MKNYSRLCATRRYLYHISYRVYRESIERYGLNGGTSKIIGYYNAVFAHNSNVITLDWYPFTLDRYEWDDIHYQMNAYGEYEYVQREDTDLLMLALERNYDIWKIDAKRLSRTWYYDNIGEKEFERSIFKREGLYVMCKGRVPLDCIELVKPQMMRVRFNTGSGFIDSRQLMLP